jgi:hypothetical protein
VSPRAWLREPLVHFLLAGAVLFAGYRLLNPMPEDERNIVIDRERLFTYLRTRAQVTDPREFDAVYRAMPAEQRQALIGRVAMDEALFRQGQAIDLARADPIVRQRIIQQMRELIADEVALRHPVGDAEVAAYYQAHRADYRTNSRATFAHVFFATGSDAEGARRRALAERARLRADDVPPAQAQAHGERFLYETRFRAVEPDEVNAKFGAVFATALFKLAPGSWQGPLRSEHGWHLVRVDGYSPGRVLTPQELGPRLREDATESLHEAATERTLARMLASYRIETARDLPR